MGRKIGASEPYERVPPLSSIIPSALPSAHLDRSRLEQLFQQAPGFICVLRGPTHIFELANDAYYQLVGHRQIIGHALARVLPEVVSQGFLDKLDRVYSTGQPFVGRALPIQLQRLVGGTLEQSYIDLIYQPIFDNERQVTGIFVQGNDVTEAHLLALEVTYQAAHDSLTGLYNRREFAKRTQSIGGSGPHALLYMDLDHFKIVNDRCGHAAGDKLLLAVADVFTECSDQEDVLARLGGDEFALVRRECAPEDAILLANRLRTAVKELSFIWDGKRYGVSLSVGVVCFGDAAKLDFEEALALADAACFLAKQKGRNRIQFTALSDEEVTFQQREMDNATRLKQALIDDRIELYSQRIVPLQPESQYKTSCEVLTRVRDVDGTLVLPGSFIPAAERFGLIEDLDRCVIQKVFMHLQHPSTRAEGAYFVNLSAVTLSSSGFEEFIEDLVNKCPEVEPAKICFEVTETAAVADMRRTARAMQGLIAQGFRFALDDFGSGMASFSYLQHLPVQFIKIDGDFVRSVLDSAPNAAIVEAVVKVARSMQIATIAEAVENVDLIPELRCMGVDYGQGFALHRPQPLTLSIVPTER
jgi:diguanylate cyclase (GGDEF)-like protein